MAFDLRELGDSARGAGSSCDSLPAEPSWRCRFLEPLGNNLEVDLTDPQLLRVAFNLRELGDSARGAESSCDSLPAEPSWRCRFLEPLGNNLEVDLTDPQLLRVAFDLRELGDSARGAEISCDSLSAELSWRRIFLEPLGNNLEVDLTDPQLLSTFTSGSSPNACFI